jgi:inner membrane transporter RhtA
MGLLAPAPSPALVLGAIASVQFGSAIATTLFAQIGPGGAVWLRLLFGSLILVPLWRPRWRGYARRELLLAILFGLVLAGMNFSFYSSIHRIPLGIAVTIEFVGPLVVAIAGSRRALDLVWVALAAAGILALTRGGVHHLDGLGVALALLAGCFWAAYILINARVGRAFEGATGLSLAMCVGTVVMTPLGIAQGGSHLLEPRSLLLGAAVGLLSSAIPYSFENEALRRIRPGVFGVLMSIEPAMAALAGFIVLGQGLAGREVVGIALVVIASVGAAHRAREAPVDL